MLRALAGIALVALAGTAGIAGYRLLRAELAADVYRGRLEALADDYRTLHSRYEEVVRRTAVTELRVEEGRLSVLVRRADGRVHEVPTPYDPGREIYVDFAVLDGRLWIRRVFGEDTPPREGVLVDPALGAVDWDADDDAFGKAAYRTLGEGRWVVTVTGGGALGLERAGPRAPVELSPPPPIRRPEPVASRVDERLRDVGPGELLAVLLRALAGLQG